MSKELASALLALEKDKGISREVILEALEAALISAYRRNYRQAQNVEVDFNEETGSIKVYAVKEVVDSVLDSTLEISLADAREIHPAYEIGDQIRFEVTPHNFGRIAAQTAKQVITQRLREAERSLIYEEFIDYEDDLLTGTVEREDGRFVYINLGKIEAALTPEGQIPGEHFESHERVKVYIERVENTTKGPQIYVSRSHPNMIKRLFENEVPEVYDGTVEIRGIAREAGERAKIAVYSNDPNIDPVGTCVGTHGNRVQTVVNELNGENMDIIEWSDDPATYIEHALNPAEVLSVHFENSENACVVVVSDHHLSLAIGKQGQNVRLAAKLTGYRIDIKAESEFQAYQQTEEYEERFGEKSESLEDDNEEVFEAEDSSDAEIEGALESEKNSAEASKDETLDEEEKSESLLIDDEASIAEE